jgi:capsular polysaccharide biosynthesis protein
MLQRQSFVESAPDQDQGPAFSLAYFFDIAKRRALYFIIPFLVILVIGSVVTFAWPAKYLAQGTILISSQEIPADLVRPTVSTLANERIQYIQQRILTRDNILALAKKFNLSGGWRSLISGSEVVDFIRERTIIKPVEATLQSDRKQAIAFHVGFEYEQPQVAARVANELVTMILGEDVRTRTAFASETTKFLEREVKRLEDQLSAINTEITERQKMPEAGPTEASDDARNLATLRAQLAIKSANFSESHPDIRSLKRQIQALEKSAGSERASTPRPAPVADNAPAQKDVVAGGTNPLGIDTLLTQRVGIRQELTNTNAKLAAARLGETLERGQHSERLEVIEQPTLPKKPTSPNRPKIFAFVFAFALMAGGGLLVGAEMLNPAIRRSTDLLSLVESHLIVSIPHITTRDEVVHKKSRRTYWIAAFAVLFVAALAAVFFILPPTDTWLDKAMTILLR